MTPDSQHSKLSDDLNSVLLLHEKAVGEIIESVGEKGFGLLFCIISLPSALPIPAPGYSVPFGFLLFFLGIELIIGKKSPWLPNFLNSKTIRKTIIAGALKKAARFFGFLEKFIRPRCNFIASSGGLKAGGLLVIMMAVLMMIPIPLTNTLPAMIIFLIGTGILEKDGVILAIALLAGLAAACFYSFFAYLISIYGLDAVDHLRNMLS
jgi:hypothetical protein